MSKSEKQTRIEFIDKQLGAAGWNVVDLTQVVHEFDIFLGPKHELGEAPVAFGHEYSDYVLLGKDRKPLAVVEAKRSSKDAEIGREQAKQYCYNIQKEKGGELPGKTIFFCSSIPHARRLEEVFDGLFPEHAGELAKVLVSDDARVYGKGGLLDQFKNNDMPRIAISVDMLDTGIDVREIVNLVFAKPVYSYTKFWQMIGRGTRLLEPTRIRPWCPEKDIFLIIDCWDNFEYFKLQPKGKALQMQLPLPVRLVAARLDKIEKALELAQTEIAAKEIALLREQIVQLPKNSVVIREAAEILSQIAPDAFWAALGAEQFKFLRQQVKPLFRTVSQVDFKAMRFTKILLDASIALLGKQAGDQEDSSKLAALSEAICEQISELQLSVPMVKRHETLIASALRNQFWATCTDTDLAKLGTTLGPLMQFRDTDVGGGGTVSLNLQDALHRKESVEFGPQHEAVSITRYRKMVEAMVLAMTETNPVLQTIRDGGDVTPEQADALVALLEAEHPHVTEELLRTVYRNRKARFIQFIQEHSDLTSRQLDFLRLLKDFIIERETIEKRDLIQSPFTVIHPQGIRGVFSPAEITEILAPTEELAS